MTKYSVGDFVEHQGDYSIGIVLSPNPASYPEYIDCLWLFHPDNAHINLRIEYLPKILRKIEIDSDDIPRVKYCLALANESGKIDNLTYIELLDKLK